ncbi:MAG: hypothetical protein J5501_07625 [Ruminococcus sp.]|nr:hypothetical protein [Ruminococcus sp.]
MGEQFWWIYDAAIAAIILVFVFISSRKGLVKTAISLACSVLALVIAFSVSSAVSKGVYKTMIRPSTIKNVSKDLYSDSVKKRLVDQLNGLDYHLSVREDKITDLLNDENSDFDHEVYVYANNINAIKVAEEDEFKEELHKIYGQIIYELVAKNCDPYIAEAARNLTVADPSCFQQIGRELNEEEGGQREAAAIISDNYIAPTYSKVFRYISFIAMFVIVSLLAFFIVKSFSENIKSGEAVSHIVGGVLGIFIGIIVIIVIAVVIKLNVVLGNNEMMVFNKDTVDKTLVFKHIYNIVAGM